MFHRNGDSGDPAAPSSVGTSAIGCRLSAHGSRGLSVAHLPGCVASREPNDYPVTAIVERVVLDIGAGISPAAFVKSVILDIYRYHAL